MITQLDSSDEDRIEFSRMIKKSSTRLINTINGYMDISMIVSGLTEINKRSFLLSKFIDKIRKHVVASCESRNLKLDIIFNIPERNIEIITDEDLLSKIFYHLTDNAVKFTKKGSITVGYELKPGFHTFSVSDTGSGISEELLTVIFDVFRQADLSISRGYEGSGLGLSIARGFVRLLGGDLWVKSEINHGSTFWFTIPAEGIKADLGSIPAKSNGELPLVVVAEDDDSNYKYLEIVLKKASFKVMRARNGFETVDLCHEHPNISLLITDMKMPGMDGLESTRKIREQLPLLPVIALSGLISSNDEQAARDAGCNEYMVKPVSKAKLLEAISKLMLFSH
jgi:CheY-like chemotaxis protein